MMHRTLTLATVLLLALTMGCTTVQKWAAGGAVVGATVGGIMGAEKETLLNAGEGALVGAATGGLVGALVGEYIEERNERDADAEINGLHAEHRALKAK